MSTFTPFICSGAPAGLDFTVDKPADWVAADVPSDEIDFADPLQFVPIAVLMTQYAPVVFTVVARPAYADGTVAQWLQYAAHARGLDPGTMEQDAAGPHAAVGCWGMQQDGGLLMRVRMLLWEDGGRMINISCMAPEPLWATFAPVFRHMVQSFALTTPRGATVALAGADAPLAANTMVAVAPAPATPPPGPLPLPGEDVALPGDEVPAAAVALAPDMRSFEPEHEHNVRLADRGAGRVPDVLDYHEQELWATLATPALGATLRVPFGWHVVDDGKRTLVLDAAGHSQVDLTLLARDGRSDDALLDAAQTDLQRQHPALHSQPSSLAGMPCRLLHGLSLGGKPVAQAWLLRPAPSGRVLRVRATASPEHLGRTCDLVAVVLRDVQFTGAHPMSTS